ncbi:hypothetical protein GLP09_02955 [Photobacterium carnosum]|nr:hypothetical protein [Photobacterium carnosum]
MLFDDVKIALGIVLFFITIDTIWRLTNPGAPTEAIEMALQNQSGLGFYLYKYNTFMFADSNSIGIALQCIFFLLLFFSRKGYRSNKLMFYTFVLILLTFSRAAILATVIMYVIINFKLYKNIIFQVLLGLLITIITIIFLLFYHVDINLKDGSALSKFYILDVFYNYLLNSNALQLLFGCGGGETKNVLGIYGHISFVTSIVDIGLFGTIIYAIFFIVSVLKTKGESLIIILPIAISSLSYVLYLGVAFMFIPLAIIEYIKIKENQNEE